MGRHFFNMFKKLYFNTDLPFPHISLVLILCSLVVSIPIYFDQTLYFNLGANYGLHYPFQVIISRFAHGPNPPLILHLLANVLVIAMFGILTERILGTPKTLLLVVLSIIVELIIRYSTNRFGNGISGAAWSFSPFGFYFLILYYRNQRKKFLKDPFAIFLSLLLILIWIVITIYTGLKYHWLTGTNIYHAAAVITGILFLKLNNSKFRENFQQILDSKSIKISLSKRFSILLNAVIYLFLIFITGFVIYFLFKNSTF